MTSTRSLTIAPLICASFAAYGQANLSPDAVNLLNASMNLAQHGQTLRAEAALDCLLIPRGLSVGMETPGAMSRAVQHGVEVWGDRLEGAPFRFTAGRDPDIKVRFVNAIQGNGDLQGQVRLERYVRWGKGGASYHLKGTILVCDNVEGRPLSSPELSSVVEHELGHVLGLDDAQGPGQLMGPFVPGRPVDGPTDEEVAKISELRATVRRGLADIAAASRSSYRPRG